MPTQLQLLPVTFYHTWSKFLPGCVSLSAVGCECIDGKALRGHFFSKAGENKQSRIWSFSMLWLKYLLPHTAHLHPGLVRTSSVRPLVGRDGRRHVPFCGSLVLRGCWKFCLIIALILDYYQPTSAPT